MATICIHSGSSIISDTVLGERCFKGEWPMRDNVVPEKPFGVSDGGNPIGVPLETCSTGVSSGQANACVCPCGHGWSSGYTGLEHGGVQSYSIDAGFPSIYGQAWQF